MTNKLLSWMKSIVGVSFIITLIVIGIRQIGGLESWELTAFDQMLRLQYKPDSNPKLNERILIVEITESDIATQKQWPLSDQVLADALSELNKQKPVAIALDLFRDIPVNPGHEEFSEILQNNKNIIPVCKVSDTKTLGVKPPAKINKEQIGFADVTVDPGGIVRRGLIFTEPSESSVCESKLSLAFQLAKLYLTSKDLNPELIKEEKEELLKWGNVVFKPLSPNSGGYHKVDSRGYQILLNYELINNTPRFLTLDDVINGNFESSWIKDNIVLIGVNAPSVDDAFYTPYSAGQKLSQKMPGVMIHAQLTSQIISAVLEENNLFWFYSQGQENLWILVWGIVGAAIVYYIRHPLNFVLVVVGGFIILIGGSFVLFLQGGWIPFIPASLNLIGSSILGLIYRNYKEQKEKDAISDQIQQQERAIASLQALLKNTATIIVSDTTKLENSDNVTRNLSEREIETTLLTQAQSSQGLEKVLVGRYKLLKILGSGGFAYAYLAEDIQRPGSPQCLVKQLQPASSDEQFLEVARRLFKAEANILEKLGNHSQIPQLLAHFEEDNHFYLVEEFIPGIILSKEIKKNAPFSEKFVIEFLKDILSILSYIHGQGVIHRDLKPGNIIRRQSDQCLVLIDFGAVKHIQPNYQYNEDEYTIAIGTRGYAPAEQLAGKPYFSSDIYAVGVIAIQALTGISPDKLPLNKNAEIQWHDLVDIHPSFVAILDKMVHYHFKDRYNCADNIIQDLNKLL